MSKPEDRPSAQLMTYDPFRGQQVQSVPIESNRATNPLASFDYYWSKYLVRRGDPLSQLFTSAFWTTLNAAVSHFTLLIGAVPFAVYMVTVCLLTLICGVALIENQRLTGHALLALLFTVAGIIIGVL
jgi:hypothetical protein